MRTRFSPLSRLRLAFLVSTVLVSLGLVVLLRADTVYLKNGAWIDGMVRARNEKVLEIEIGKIGKLEVPIDEIHEIEKNNRTGEDFKPSGDGTKLDVKSVAREGKRPDEKDAKSGDSKPGSKSADADAKDSKDSKDAKDDDGDDKDSSDSDKKKEEIAPELKAKIEQLVEDLQRQKPQFRTRAERHLRAIGEPALPFLVPLVKNESELTRTTVAHLFYEFGNESVIEPCIGMLLDSNEFVRDYANKALERITHENFGYQPNASPRRQEIAQEKWRKWWETEKAELENVEKLKKKN